MACSATAASSSSSSSSSSCLLVIVAKQVVIGDQIQSASIHVREGKIVDVKPFDSVVPSGSKILKLEDECILLPGVVDSHVHVNEPGRTDWEGFDTATRAAAAGGITVIADMPLNSVPPTTTVKNFEEKLKAAQGKCWIDVRFIGGVVNDNEEHLLPLVEKGVCGFKCFLINSGVEEFSYVSPEQAFLALKKLQSTDVFLMFHAELEEDIDTIRETLKDQDSKEYNTFLQSRPKSMENRAIEMVISLCRESRVRCHIVHLSSSDAIPLIQRAKEEGLPLSVETCYHYLYFEAEMIPRAEPKYKCCPPIREHSNRERLWSALGANIIDLVVSDHSPCTSDLKSKSGGDYLTSWGGISSLQFGLSVLFTEATRRGYSLVDVVRWICEKPAELIGLGARKGKIAVGFDSDFVVFNPTRKWIISKDQILFKNKMSAYEGQEVIGLVEKTIVRGHTVYCDGKIVTEDGPRGLLLLGKQRGSLP